MQCGEGGVLSIMTCMNERDEIYIISGSVSCERSVSNCVMQWSSKSDRVSDQL